MSDILPWAFVLLAFMPFPLMLWVVRKYHDNNEPIETDIEARLRAIEELLAL